MSEKRVLFSDILKKKPKPGFAEKRTEKQDKRPVTFLSSGLQNLIHPQPKSATGAKSENEERSGKEEIPDVNTQHQTDPAAQSRPDAERFPEDIAYGNGVKKDQSERGQNDGPERPAGKAIYHGDLERLKKLEAWKKLPPESKIREMKEMASKEEERTAPAGGTSFQGSFWETDEPQQLYSGIEDVMTQIKLRIQNSDSFSIEAISKAISTIVDNPGVVDKIYPLTLQINPAEDYNISHQVNTMIYALKIGIGFSLSKKKLNELALAAVLHDVGMFLVPPEIINKDEKLNPSDLNIIKRHPTTGRDILSDFANLPWLAEVAYEHHERENGQGYPLGLTGDQICEYAKIISIVDSYEAMTHNRPYRKALMQSFSAQELIKAKNLLFSPAVIKVFLKEISIYPLGSYVRLNNKSIGQVIGTDQSRPLRPDVRIMWDGEGNRVEGEFVVRLQENPIFFIQDSVGNEELPKS